ncbi:hypothetical protein MZM54_00760 [[Brevibacterium] frigoritolerans]|nr:hypothetical protein [Peribacillus frigoritolerans]
MNKNECEKCKKLNEKLGIENFEDNAYVAFCDECWDKRLGEYEGNKKK